MKNNDKYKLKSVYQLSRNIQIRPESEGFVVESDLSGKKIALPNPASVQLLLPFSQPARLDQYLDRLKETARATVLQFFTRCLDAEIILEVPVDKVGEPINSHRKRHLEIHDLAYHIRSRRGRFESASGATGRNADTFAASPERHENRSRVRGEIKLPKPSSIRDQLLTLRSALEGRRTRYSTEPISTEALSALLYRSCRVTKIFKKDGERLINKVYPSGGSLHSIETYIIAHRCKGIPRGGYHYDAFEHRLDLISEQWNELDELLAEAQGATGQLTAYPSILLIFSSRFARVARKYQSIAYHLMLQETGALYQTLYLNCEAEGLSACAIGAGNSNLFCDVFKTDFFKESSIGEFIIGG